MEKKLRGFNINIVECKYSGVPQLVYLKNSFNINIVECK